MTTDTSPSDLWAELERAGEVPAVSEDVLLAARVGVRRAATTESLRANVLRVRRRRRMRVGGGLVAATVAVSLVFGMTRLDVGGHRVGAPSAAAAVLERAADATLAQHDLVAGPGQYLRERLVEQSWSIRAGSDREILRGDDGRLVVGESRRTRTIWIPHDTSLPWVFRDGTVALRNNSTDPELQEQGEPTRTWAQPGWTDPHRPGYVQTYDPRWYTTLPRDPEKLLTALREQSGAEGSGTEYDFAEIYSEVLRSGVAPADIRAALFEGLARTPGMRVDENVTTLDGRKGIAIRYRTSTWGMVFDVKTGRYIGERATNATFPRVPGLDADKTTYLTSVTTDVVDQAPNAQPLK